MEPAVTNPSPLKQSGIFRQVSRAGEWVQGDFFSLGAAPNGSSESRIGMRARRAVGNAVMRNRAKRRMRAGLYGNSMRMRAGYDVIVILERGATTAPIEALRSEFIRLCERVCIH